MATTKNTFAVATLNASLKGEMVEGVQIIKAGGYLILADNYRTVDTESEKYVELQKSLTTYGQKQAVALQIIEGLTIDKEPVYACLAGLTRLSILKGKTYHR